jgi:hypothetical protein
MRPPGEIRMALRTAAADLVTRLAPSKPEEFPTYREIASSACVGVAAARRTIDNMTRAGELEVAGTRRVEHRNKPVATYRPKDWRTGADGVGFVALGQLMAAWRR